MAVILPDWLKPADPLRGAEEGASLGLQQRGQNISAGENAARLAQSAQEAGAAHQIQQQIEQDGFYVRCTGGTEFYFYNQEPIVPSKASIGGSQVRETDMNTTSNP